MPVQSSTATADWLIGLGFSELYPPVIPGSRVFTDGRLHLQLSPADRWRESLLLFTEQSLDSLAAELQQTGLQTAVQDNKVRVVAPGGLAVYWLHLHDYDIPLPDEAVESRCGSFYELSLEVADLQAARMFWQTLGFKKTMPEGDSSSWLSMSSPLLTIGLYKEGSCPHPFHSPAVTFFNADAAERLQQLRRQGIALAHSLPEDSAEPEEGILASPDGHHFFLFKAW
ncbi:hypothetical protein [Cesiribacter andamanensis]|uniref:hypothetical protein n=1 Tax=Cesiribacter andamanensis TaxID=649507 RepID=UPI001378774E|nr:hypothetical protein [Cesiribacter andamanensis]